jgi:hypothetical protein
MKTDVNGCSTTAPGQEQWEEYLSISGETRIQYDYRTPEGKLFACVAKSLEAAREKRDNWLEKQAQP